MYEEIYATCYFVAAYSTAKARRVNVAAFNCITFWLFVESFHDTRSVF